jgi:hypothetical protein
VAGTLEVAVWEAAVLAAALEVVATGAVLDVVPALALPLAVLAVAATLPPQAASNVTAPAPVKTVLKKRRRARRGTLVESVGLSAGRCIGRTPLLCNINDYSVSNPLPVIPGVVPANAQGEAGTTRIGTSLDCCPA